ncbi:MAG: hypothetical protein WA738_13625 [Candidatus Angelobacter sp.]
MMKSRRIFSLALSLVTAASLGATTQKAFAKDDFGQIVKHIETQYHVHRQHRFLMGVAGFTVKFWHFAGVKNFKGAMFENQRFLNADSDTRFDEVVRAAMNSGWQPLVQEFDRHSGERTYIYAQDLGKDLKVLAVILESNEAVVVQVKVNPAKLEGFIQEAGLGHRHHDQINPREDLPLEEDGQKIEVAVSSEQGWDGFCLSLDTDAVRLPSGFLN